MQPPEAFFEAGASSGLMAALFTSGIALPHIAASAKNGQSADLVDRFVRPTLAGEKIGSLAITDRDRELALDAALSPRAEWEADPDFGVELLVSPVEGVDEGLLVPRFLYRRADRIYEYAAAVPDAKRRLDSLISGS